VIDAIALFIIIAPIGAKWYQQNTNFNQYRTRR